MRLIKGTVVIACAFALMLVALAVSGMRITAGISSPSDTLFAKTSLKILSIFGHYSAPHMLASMNLFQSESEAERRQGFLYLQQEAADGSCYAAGKIGWAYQRGLGVDADSQKAIFLYERAAKCGMTYWQILLSHAHKEGYLGFVPDEKLSSHWREMEPKVHAGNYECWVATYYQDGIFPPNELKAALYEKKCTEIERAQE